MGGPSLISGLAGSVSGPGQQGQGTPDILSIVKAVQQIQGQKKEQAQSELGMMLDLLDKHGIAPDEQAFMKTAKSAGVPIDNLTKALEGNKQGAQSATGLASNSAEKNPGGGVGLSPKLAEGAKAGGEASGSTGSAQSPFDAMVARAQQSIKEHSTTQSMTEHMNQMVLGLKEQAAAGGESGAEAVGKLMNMGQMEFNLDQTMWAKATPEEREHMIAIKAGQESPAQKELRLSNQAGDLFRSGRYASLSDARQAAEGKDVKTLPDLGRMADEAKLYNEIFSATGSTKYAKDIAQKMANGVSLADAVPEGVKPVLQQQLDMQRRQVAADESRASTAKESLAVDRERIAMEGERYKAADMTDRAKVDLDTQKMMLALKEAGDKDFNSRFDNMVSAARSGKVDVPADMQKNMIGELAVRSGMTPERTTSVWRWLTFRGYEGTDYVPDTSKDQNLINSATGGSQKPAEQKAPTPVGNKEPSKSTYTPVGQPVTDVLNKDLGGVVTGLNAVREAIVHPYDTAKKAGKKLKTLRKP